jgi:hypothetical protein
MALSTEVCVTLRHYASAAVTTAFEKIMRVWFLITRKDNSEKDPGLGFLYVVKTQERP